MDRRVTAARRVMLTRPPYSDGGDTLWSDKAAEMEEASTGSSELDKYFWLGLNLLIEDPPESDDRPRYLQTARKYLAATAETLQIGERRISDPQNLLRRFEEVFLATIAILDQVSPPVAERARAIESELDLSQNLVRISFHRGHSIRNWTLQVRLLSFLGIDFPIPRVTLPNRGEVRVDPDLMVEFRSALHRLSAVVATAQREAERLKRDREDILHLGGVFDPERVSKEYVTHFINRAIKSLQDHQEIPAAVRDSMVESLVDISRDLGERETPWNRVFSKLPQVAWVLAALVTIGANVDDAYDNVRRALDFIGQSSVNFSSVEIPPRTPEDSLSMAPGTPEEDPK